LAVLGLIVVVTVVGLVLPLVCGDSFKDRSATWGMLAIGLVAGLGLPAWVLFIRLVVEVRPEGICYRFVGMHLRPHRIAWDDVACFYARRYKPIREYGGWGVRWSASGKAYNVKGDRGVQLVLRDGRRVLFGSQRAAELEEAIREASGREPLET
jgi:hypothetical protein